MVDLDPLDAALLFSADNIYRRNAPKPYFERLPVSAIIKKFRDNKVSLKVLQLVVNKLDEEFYLPLKEVDNDEESIKQWIESLSFASKLFRSYNANCVFIKALNPSWAIMSDLDILPASGLDELKALKALKDEGYELHQFRLLRHPLKIMALKDTNKISIDFYPQPMWIRKKVCDARIITSRKILVQIKGIPAFCASAEDDIYLIGTHGCGHLKFSLAEILHGINILENTKHFDWDYLYNLSVDYGTADTVFTYLKTIDLYLKNLHSKEFYDLQTMNRFKKMRVCRNLDHWLEKNYSAAIRFPINLPPHLICGQGSFYHTKSMTARLSLVDLTYDFLTPYLEWASKIILGKS